MDIEQCTSGMLGVKKGRVSVSSAIEEEKRREKKK
jgi:hypothetical protein